MNVHIGVAVDDCTKNFGELTGLNALAIYDYISRGDGTSYGSRIGAVVRAGCMGWRTGGTAKKDRDCAVRFRRAHMNVRSEEHTSELQSRLHLVCRLLLEKKKK